jgi:hypothetical protein
VHTFAIAFVPPSINRDKKIRDGFLSNFGFALENKEKHADETIRDMKTHWHLVGTARLASLPFYKITAARISHHRESTSVLLRCDPQLQHHVPNGRVLAEA